MRPNSIRLIKNSDNWIVVVVFLKVSFLINYYMYVENGLKKTMFIKKKSFILINEKAVLQHVKHTCIMKVLYFKWLSLIPDHLCLAIRLSSSILEHCFANRSTFLYKLFFLKI